MSITNVSARLFATVAAAAISAAHVFAQAPVSTQTPVSAQAIPTASVQIPGLKGAPQFPPSSVVLQTALNDFYHCIDNTVAATTQAKTATADTVISQCATPQAQLQRMLPSDAYNKGMTDARQRINNGLAAQATAAAAQ